MPSTFSPALRLELIGNGEQAANWGNTTNTNLGTLLEQAITGVGNITMADANYTLISGNGISDEARNAVLVVAGTLSATRNLVVPTSNKFYAVRNATTGGQSILIKTSAGTGVTLANGFTQLMYCDGTNVVLASVAINSTTGDIAAGSITASSAVISANSSTSAVRITQIGSGNALLVEDSANPDATPFVVTADGNVGIGTTSPSVKLDVATAGSNVQIGATDGTVIQRVGYCGFGNAFSGTASNHPYVLLTNDAERMRIGANGNVGIGTASPGSSLEVNGGIRARGGPPGGGGINNNGYAFNGNSGDNDSGMFSSVDGQVEFYTNSVEHVRITPTGNVGIGTTSPTNRLTVSGNANVTGTSSVGGDSSVGGNLAVTGTITSGGGLVMPTGAILEYGGSSAPTGWLLCNGAAVSRATFAALFAVIGTAYGAGDGFSTFNVPNRQDRVGVGAGLSYARGATGGAVTATTSTDGAHNHTGNTGGTAITTAQMPSHTHTGTTNTAGAHTHNVNTPNTFGEFQNNGFPVACDTLSGFSFNVTTGSSGVHDHAFTTNATGGGATHNHTISTDGSHNHTVSTLQPYLASTFIIKT